MGDVRHLPPGDPKLIDTIVNLMKCQGIFDELRRDSLADVDTRPAYQNLRHRVESYVDDYLRNTQWRPDLNKNQLRDAVRRHINDSEMLTTGVDRIVDQAVTPKIYQVFLPKITEIVHNFLGIEKPVTAKPEEKMSADGSSSNALSSSILGETSAVATTLIGVMCDLPLKKEKDKIESLSTVMQSDSLATADVKKTSKDVTPESSKGAATKTEQRSHLQDTKNEKRQAEGEGIKSKQPSKPNEQADQRNDGTLDSSKTQKKIAASSIAKSKVINKTQKSDEKAKATVEKPKSITKSKDAEPPATKDDRTRHHSESKDDHKSSSKNIKPHVEKASIEKSEKKEKPKIISEKSGISLESDKRKKEETLETGEGKTKFPVGSRFRSLGSEHEKEKSAEEKSTKKAGPANIAKAKPSSSKHNEKSLKTFPKAVRDTTTTTEQTSPNKDAVKTEPSTSSHKKPLAPKRKVEQDVSTSPPPPPKANVKVSQPSAEDEMNEKELKRTKNKPTVDVNFKKSGASNENPMISKEIPTGIVSDADVEDSVASETEPGFATHKNVPLDLQSKEEQAIHKTETKTEAEKLTVPPAVDSEYRETAGDSELCTDTQNADKSHDDENHGSEEELSDVSVSSVHTSDLSDFDGNISLTENEEDIFGKDRMMDVEAVLEDVLQRVIQVVESMMTCNELDNVDESATNEDDKLLDENDGNLIKDPTIQVDHDAKLEISDANVEQNEEQLSGKNTEVQQTSKEKSSSDLRSKKHSSSSALNLKHAPQPDRKPVKKVEKSTKESEVESKPYSNKCKDTKTQQNLNKESRPSGGIKQEPEEPKESRGWHSAKLKAKRKHTQEESRTSKESKLSDNLQESIKQKKFKRDPGSKVAVVPDVKSACVEYEPEVQPRRELRRQRRLNPRYASDDFSSIFNRGRERLHMDNLFYEIPCRGAELEHSTSRGSLEEIDDGLSSISDASEIGEVTTKVVAKKNTVRTKEKEGCDSDHSCEHKVTTPERDYSQESRSSNVGGRSGHNSRRSGSPVEVAAAEALKPDDGDHLNKSRTEPDASGASKSEVVSCPQTVQSVRQRGHRTDNQRYDSTDLYKPRHTFARNRRLRSTSSTQDEEPTRSPKRRNSNCAEESSSARQNRPRGRPRRQSDDRSSSPRGGYQRSVSQTSHDSKIKRRRRV